MLRKKTKDSGTGSWPLPVIILLHIGLLYALQNGMLREAAKHLPKEVFASFITPDVLPAPEVPKPKLVPLIRKAVVTPSPIVPAVNTTPSETAITSPAEPAVSTEPPAQLTSATPAPAVSAPSTPIKTISLGVEYIQAPQPAYPVSARRMREEGKVILRVLVNEKGQPERVDIQTTSGSPRLDEAARQAGLRALFKPHLEAGKAVAVYALIPINFELNP